MLFIVNPISGKGRKARIIAHLKEKGMKVVCTEYAGHAEVLSREAAERIIVAVGGDGTVNEVARGIVGTDKVLGIIPCGSGDGLALHLGISRHYRQALKTILKGDVQNTVIYTIGNIHFSFSFSKYQFGKRFVFKPCGSIGQALGQSQNFAIVPGLLADIFLIEPLPHGVALHLPIPVE